jgi:hypothetical protein
VRHGSCSVIESHAEVRRYQHESAQIGILGGKKSSECGPHGESNDAYDRVFFFEVSELESREFEPLVPARYDEVLHRASVTRQQWSTNTEPSSMKLIREKGKCLGGVTEAV